MIPEQLAELSHREATLRQWLARPDLSDKIRQALMEELRRNRALQRALSLKQMQGPAPLSEEE